MNTLAYIIYLIITYIITVHVGFLFYRNGRHYILEMFHGNVSYTDKVNRLLLTGYYLINLGYSAVMIGWWGQIGTWNELATTLCSMVGKIMFTLAIMHYCNMAVIILLTKFNKQILKN